MMITPLEIQEKEFSRGLKGFKEEEVNEFLDQITLDLESLMEENHQLRKENIQLHEDNEQLRDEIRKTQESEHSVIQTLETAKALLDDISVSAEKRAQILLKNAELEAETMLREAREAAAGINEEYALMQNKLAGFRRKYKELLEFELKQMEGATEELFAELSIDDLTDIPDAKGKSAPAQSAPYGKDKLSHTMVAK